MESTTGYRRDGSKSDGTNRAPYSGVRPSAAVTQNGFGGRHPSATRLSRSAVSSSQTSAPSARRRRCTGAVATVDTESTNQRPLGVNCTVWSPGSGVSSSTSPPATGTR